MKRQDYVFGSTTTNVEEQSASALNNGWAELSILYSRVLNGVCAALSQSTNYVSQEVANAIEGMGVELDDSDDSQLLSILQTLAIKSSDFNTPVTSSNKGATMKEIEELITTSLVFKGYVSTTEPTQNLIEGNLWINSATMPTNFPLAAALIKEWNGTAWVAYSSTYTPNNFDSFRNMNDNEGYYWFGGQWKVLSTDLSTDYFYLNQVSGKWEIKNNVNLPGTPTVDTPLATDTRAIANVDFVLNNSISSRNISNCIIEIPQDIKLELNNSTLTLKAGSKVYMPNGFETDGVTKKFDVINIVSDVVLTQGWASSQTFCLAVNKDGSGMAIYDIARTYSGIFTSYSSGFYYEEDKNLLNIYDNGVLNRQISFPIAIITGQSPTINSIDQVFNGFGYIGSTVFALPGIKWLAPDGRSADGALKNRLCSNTNVLLMPYPNVDRKNVLIMLEEQGLYTAGKFVTQEIMPGGSYVAWYKESENIIRIKNTGSFARTLTGIPVGVFTMSVQGVKSIRTKTPFHAVDYNDLFASTAGSLMARILDAIYRVGSLYCTTENTAACPMAELIPLSTWELVGSGRALWTGNGSNANTTIAAGVPNITGSFSTPDGQEASGNGINDATGAFFRSDTNNDIREYRTYGLSRGSLASFSASRISSVYRNDVNTVQPPAYVVNVWRRTA